jgi:hypothetical protein
MFTALPPTKSASYWTVATIIPRYANVATSTRAHELVIVPFTLGKTHWAETVECRGSLTEEGPETWRGGWSRCRVDIAGGLAF